MTKEEAKLVLDNARPQTKEIDRQFYDDEDLNNALDMAIKALEQQKPMEKFENAKDHIRKLAGDYKCWDNRLSYEESLELCNILEQQPCCNCIEFKRYAKQMGFEIEKKSIPYLMHKEMDIPILECQKAYDVAIDYLRSRGKVRG